jgi:hypothetical protein
MSTEYQSTDYKPRDFRLFIFYMAPTQVGFILPWRQTAKPNRPFYMPSPQPNICLSFILGHDSVLYICIICDIKNCDSPSSAPITWNCRQTFSSSLSLSDWNGCKDSPLHTKQSVKPIFPWETNIMKVFQ